jgi:hypothetical protein
MATDIDMGMDWDTATDTDTGNDKGTDIWADKDTDTGMDKAIVMQMNIPVKPKTPLQGFGCPTLSIGKKIRLILFITDIGQSAH